MCRFYVAAGVSEACFARVGVSALRCFSCCIRIRGFALYRLCMIGKLFRTHGTEALLLALVFAMPLGMRKFLAGPGGGELDSLFLYGTDILFLAFLVLFAPRGGRPLRAVSPSVGTAAALLFLFSALSG